ncbi:MAG TPA: excisionase family DNA-binding protein [Acetobacteraceae bacterium]|nr:excisionase family DNA-binding protein [Acetobacteraceae bacterium]
MTSKTPNPHVPVVPSAADRACARDALRLLASSLPDADRAVYLRVEEPDVPGEAIAVPASALRLLVSILRGMANGKAVHVLEHQSEVTTGEMARLLNVSPPYAVKMLDEGRIPSRLVGTHRRARLDDVLAYRDEQYKARKAVLDQMAAIDQELGLT